jgi:hypothetical protein
MCEMLSTAALVPLHVWMAAVIRASPPVCRNHNHNHKQRKEYEHMIGPKNHTAQTNHKIYGYGELAKSSPTGKPQP